MFLSKKKTSKPTEKFYEFISAKKTEDMPRSEISKTKKILKGMTVLQFFLYI